MKHNPYEPSTTSPDESSPTLQLRGFALGARNGILWSLPFMLALGLTLIWKGASPRQAIYVVALIPLLFVPVQAIGAELRERRRDREVEEPPIRD